MSEPSRLNASAQRTEAPSSEPSAVDAELMRSEIQRLLTELHPAKAIPIVHLDSSFNDDLGLDSLTRAELISRLETVLNRRFADASVMSAETPRDLMRALSQEAHFAAAKSQASQPSGATAPGVAESGSPTHAPSGARSLVEVALWHFEQHPQRVHLHLHDDDAKLHPLTYGDLVNGALCIASGLRKSGIGAGDVVVLMLPTGFDYVQSFLGVLFAGAIVLPIYPPMRATQIEEHVRRHKTILENAQAKLMIVDDQLRSAGRLLSLHSETGLKLQNTASLRGHEPLAEIAMPDESDIAFLQYTSGSTAEPKGVVLTHLNVLESLRSMRDALGLREDDRFVSWLPLYHDMGLIGMWLGPMVYGVPLLLMSPLTFLARPERWLQAISDFGATVSGGPNFAFDLCAKRVSKSAMQSLDLSRWRFIFNGAEPVRASTMRAFAEHFASVGVDPQNLAPVYGLAEATLGVSFTAPGKGLVTRYVDATKFAEQGIAEEIAVAAIGSATGSARGSARGPDGASDASSDSKLEPGGAGAGVTELVSCGLAIPGFDVRIVDDSGEELAERRVGEIQFRAVACSQGYFRNGEASATLFDGDWLRSGDHGLLWHGELFITGRVKEVIIRAGRNLYPYEIESLVGQIEGIRTGCVAAFGINDPSLGPEQLIAVAETRLPAGAQRDELEAEVARRCQSALGFAPDIVRLVGPGRVLKTSSGKIRRTAMRDRFLSNELDKVPPAPWLQVVETLLSGVSRWLRLRAKRIWQSACAVRIWISFVVCLLGVAPALLAPKLDQRWALARFAGRAMLALGGIRLRSDLSSMPLAGASAPCAMYVANHQSYFDAICFLVALERPVRFVAKRELRSVPLLGAALVRMGVLFVERFDASKSLEDASQIDQVISAGESVFVFPEGSFTHSPGILPFQLGAFSVAAQRRVPVQCLVIRGARQVLQGETFFPRPGAIDIEWVGQVDITDDDRGEWQQAVDLRDQARSHILRRAGEPDHGHRKFLAEIARQMQRD